jgi:hypothetical protein
LQRKGFEIALHGVRGGSSPRADIAAGLSEFKRVLGRYPRMQVNHSQNQDNLYWGHHLFSFPPFRWAVDAAANSKFSGHDPASPYFWGDIAKQRIDYVRRFTFPEANLLQVDTSFPYRLADKPYVNYWFPTSNGRVLEDFDRLLSPENLDALERDGGVCLVYAHLGAGSFNRGSRLDPRFEARINEVAARNGWFATASEILDFLRQQPGWTGELTARDRLRLEGRFILDKILGRGIE